MNAVLVMEVFMVGNKTVDVKGTKKFYVRTTAYGISHFIVKLSCLVDSTKLKLFFFLKKRYAEIKFPK